MQRPDPPYDEFDTVIVKEFSRDNVIGYRVKEDWFFDKQRSVMDVRIIGIAPLIYDRDEFGNVREGNIKKPLFWIYYPEARKLLANAEVFNRQNDAERRSFDDIFQKRLFGSYIYKEANVYDRLISDYRQGLSALLESERIKDDITNFEHDMWEF
jgi:gliding motility associated protien GldN